MPELPGLVRLNRLFGVQRAGQVIDYRQQLTRDICNYAVVRFTAFAFNSLAIVFKVGLPAREAFLGFVQGGLEAFELRPGSNKFRQVRTTETRLGYFGIGSVWNRIGLGVFGGCGQLQNVFGIVVSVEEANGNVIRLFMLSI